MRPHTRADSQQATVLSDDFIDSYAIVGRPSHVVDRLHEVAELGVGKVVVVGVSPGSDADEAAIASTAMARVLGAF
jgi:5,10-methylenetetrahydromethanopterin reductase